MLKQRAADFSSLEGKRDLQKPKSGSTPWGVPGRKALKGVRVCRS